MINESFETNIKPSSPPYSSKWSSNINVKQIKVERVITNQFKSDSNQLTTELNRPLTSISLPSRSNEDELKETAASVRSSLNPGQLNKNHPSCPVISKSSSTLNSSKTNNNNNSPILISSTSTNSNLDNFINLASNPFTTKFEFTGTTTNNNNSNKKKSIPIKSISSANMLKLEEEPKKLNNNNNVLAIKSISDEILNEEAAIAKKSENLNKNFLRITEKIYIGNMSAIKNERKMCKLNIEILIDMTNMKPDDLNRQTLGKLPCLCKTSHSRTILSVDVTDKSFKNLFMVFSEINKQIQYAKRTNKCALIFAREFLAPQVICACTQYLMVDFQMDLSTALKVISRKEYKNSIDDHYIDYLERLENYLKHLPTNIKQSAAAPTTSKLTSKNKIVYKSFDNFDDEDDFNFDQKKKLIHFHSIEKNNNNLNFCEISDEEDENNVNNEHYNLNDDMNNNKNSNNKTFGNKSKYITKNKNAIELLNEINEFKSIPKSNNELRKTENAHTFRPKNNFDLKMAWM